MLVILTPRSTQAKSSLANCLRGDPVVILEAMGTGEILVSSEDRSYSTWVSINGDPDWVYTFSTYRPSPVPD
jgi:hypothetical protein